VVTEAEVHFARLWKRSSASAMAVLLSSSPTSSSGQSALSSYHDSLLLQIPLSALIKLPLDTLLYFCAMSFPSGHLLHLTWSVFICAKCSVSSHMLLRLISFIIFCLWPVFRHSLFPDPGVEWVFYQRLVSSQSMTTVHLLLPDHFSLF